MLRFYAVLEIREKSKEIRIWKRKLFAKSSVFSMIFYQKNQQKVFSLNPEVTWTLKRCWGLLVETHLGNVVGDESRTKTSRRAKFQQNCSTSEEYLGQITCLRPTVPWNAPVCHSGQSSGHHEAQFLFIVCATG